LAIICKFQVISIKFYFLQFIFIHNIFHFGYVCFPEFTFRKITFQTFLCLFAIKKIDQRKTLSSQRKIWLGFQKSVFLKNLDGKLFPEIVKKLEMSYYLLIISNLVLKLLIAINILFLIFIFQFHLLKFNFYINFNPHFYNCYLLFPYHFFIEIFYVSNLVLILLIATYFIWNNLWNVNYYYFNFFIFYFFIFLIWSLLFWLLFILFEIIYEIIFFFNFILIQLFNL